MEPPTEPPAGPLRPPVVVVGAGAAGLMAAIEAALSGASVMLLDSQERIGTKVLISGGGRCNVANEEMGPQWFNSGSPAFVEAALQRYGLDDTLAFFRRLGVPLKVEPEMGKLFPVSDSARTVLDALLGAARRLGVRIRPARPVLEIREGLTVVTPEGERSARAVILCTGGLALPKSGSTGAGYAMASRLGHSVVRTTPALSPLLADPPVHAGLSGLTMPVRLQLRRHRTVEAQYTGSFLFTHTGYSGPVALNLSRHVARAETGTAVMARFIPDVEEGDERRFEAWLMEERGGRNAVMALSGLVPRRVAEMAADMAGATPGEPLARMAREPRRALMTALLDQRLPVTGVAGYPKAEATAGGVCLDEVDPATMMSRLVPGLFFAGEILDVDGCLGGYNFQWAWTSGALAGRAAAAYLG